MDTDSKTIGAVERSFDIVEVIQRRGPIGVSEVADVVSLPKSTVYTHLNTLTSAGYLIKEDGLYRLSCQYLQLGATVQYSIDLYRQGKEEVDELAAEVEERTNLVIEENGLGTCVYATNSSNSTQAYMNLGEQRPMHATATGKAILAHLPVDRVDDIVERHGLEGFTEQTITSRDGLEEELAKIRDAGISFDNEESVDGLCCIATPVIVDDHPLGSISVSGPCSQFKRPDRRDELCEALRNAANVIQLDFMLT
ncbi:IclR family transcriptional regulator [Halostella pelagica]|uniref:IclR family transcriptional regulator n=1 Tax=Halostella pelagica TaxID=2583824 RepID=UPI001080EE86|nr:IclR family transcriptional regulator [Halostella pelagica]